MFRVISLLFVLVCFVFALPAEKEKESLYNSLDKTDDQTKNTLKQIVESSYNIQAHNTNYFLPISYNYNGEYQDTNGHNAKTTETEFQFSLKYNIGADLFGLKEIYSVAYTQKSFWQLYTSSAYFRETNYNPEFFLTFPMALDADRHGLKAIKLSFAHQSNGRGSDEERSWNYLSGSFIFQYDYLFTELKLWTSWKSALEYNPDLLDYLGYGSVKFIVPYKKNLFSFKVNSKGTIESNYSYPISSREDLFLYVKVFSGYGESLIDYDNYINKVGIGFSISR